MQGPLDSSSLQDNLPKQCTMQRQGSGWFVRGLRFSLDLGCSKCVPIRFPIMFLVCSQVPMCSPRCSNSITLYAISFAQNSTQWKGYIIFYFWEYPYCGCIILYMPIKEGHHPPKQLC
jgi:hypothetical protein